MAHKHSVYDTDTHFTINPTTRALKNEASTKTNGIQFDHNSERFTFEIPRKVEDHDMSLCNVIQIHYINIDSQTKAKNVGVYEVDDMQVSPESDDVVILSWLISQNATQLVGSLNFLIRFACVTDGNVDYVWNTAIYSGISVSSGIYNGDAVVEEYADILEQWRQELIESGGVTDERIASAVEAYMEENPVTTGGSGLSDTAKTLLITILQNAVFTSDQFGNITALEAALGTSDDSGGSSGDSSTYSVTNNLTNATTDNASIMVAKNAAYSATLTAADGYSITNVTIIMGGVDVTETAYTDGVVNIESVTGNVTITVETALISTENPFDYTTWTEGTRIIGNTGAEYTGHSEYATSDYVDMANYSIVTITTTKTTNQKWDVSWYGADKAFISGSTNNYIHANSTTYPSSITFEKPDGASYCRLCSATYGTITEGYITFTVA